MSLVVLLGPQRFRPTVGEVVVRSLQVEGPIATVTAGWEERESDNAGLDDLLGGRGAWPPHERPTVADHRAEIAGLLGRAGALAIAGGHVGVLLSCLHLFNVAAAVRRLPVVAWSNRRTVTAMRRAHCLILDDGARVRCADGVCCPSGSVVVGDNGAVTSLAA